MNVTSLVGKVALVTGGGRGIGRGIVDAFQAAGAQVTTCGRGPRPEDLDPRIDWICADVSKWESAASLCDGVVSTHGALHILVNNAGVQIEKTVVESTNEDWETLIGINAKGLFACCRAAIPAMIRSDGGSIINIGSTSGFNSEPTMALYNASKAFVHGLTRSIAVDHGGEGIRCNAICPGWIMTELSESAFALARDPEAAKGDALARHPIGRFGKPQDVAATAVWLASGDAGFVTGQTFVVDGGLLAASPIHTGLF